MHVNGFCILGFILCGVVMFPVIVQEENMKLKRQKTDSGDDYCWTDYMSLQFTQNVSENAEKEDESD